jgi:hypothetical protein
MPAHCARSWRRRTLVGAVLASHRLPFQLFPRPLFGRIGPDVAAVAVERFEADVLGNVSDQVAVAKDVFESGR